MKRIKGEVVGRLGAAELGPVPFILAPSSSVRCVMCCYAAVLSGAL